MLNKPETECYGSGWQRALFDRELTVARSRTIGVLSAYANEQKSPEGILAAVGLAGNCTYQRRRYTRQTKLDRQLSVSWDPRPAGALK